MGNQNTTNESRKYPTSFGLFYPIGYLVVGFKSKEDAKQVQQDLFTGGYVPEDCEFFTCKEVAEAAERNLDTGGFLPRLGGADKVIEIHLKAAEEGASFLVIYAPEKTSVDRAMNVIRRVPFEFAHRYHRLAIEELE
ncbi:hypothetical protein [Nitrosovibrio sp. Nv6]|uniref:hypothetical protein n=1 Tax=Nitrosovibrio sp. Nv6 TaxID=1855340 RepID=UPI0008C8A4FE|nr:hypothetical protein [Nitrosovibrio sp. Nv6]SEP11028.1 hypothetical protein SAMN05216316_1775 [Nitrosovibrio sp. Nv6]